MTEEKIGSAPSAPIFDDAVPTSPPGCSTNVCSNGHTWPPVLATVRCAGCDSVILAVQKTQCPYCNEPIVRTLLRSDFVPRGAGAARRCKGEPVYGETLDLELTRHEWKEVENTSLDSLERFEERRCKERTAEV